MTDLGGRDVPDLPLPSSRKEELMHMKDRIATVFELIQRASETCGTCEHEEGSMPLSPFQKIQNASIENLREAIDECRSAMTD
tara:strand:+ start:267 stop:515 length:249 start_codon:yes stop_codon:yes gene_type:complete